MLLNKVGKQYKSLHFLTLFKFADCWWSIFQKTVIWRNATEREVYGTLKRKISQILWHSAIWFLSQRTTNEQPARLAKIPYDAELKEM